MKKALIMAFITLAFAVSCFAIMPVILRDKDNGKKRRRFLYIEWDEMLHH